MDNVERLGGNPGGTQLPRVIYSQPPVLQPVLGRSSPPGPGGGSRFRGGPGRPTAHDEKGPGRGGLTQYSIIDTAGGSRDASHGSQQRRY